MDGSARTELRQRLEQLRSLPLEAALAALANEARELEARLAACEEQRCEDVHGPATLQALELGLPLRSLHALVDALSPSISSDPLDFLEDDLEWIERSARELGRLNRSLAEAGQQVLQHAGQSRCLLAELRRERLVGAEPIPTAAADPSGSLLVAWERIQESFDVEVRLRRVDHDRSLLAPKLLELEAHRQEILRTLGECLRRCELSSRARFVVETSARLLDRSSSVLAEVVPAASLSRLPQLRVLREQVRIFLELLLPILKELEKEKSAESSQRSVLKERSRLLRAARSRARALEREGEARQRIDNSFYGRIALRSEAPLLLLVVLFVGVVILEWRLPGDSPWLKYVHGADIALCLIFQAEFFLRWSYTRWSWSYFWRHFFLESLPAVPYGFLLHHAESMPGWAGMEELRAVIIVRLLSLRGVLLVFARSARIVAFFVRGTDRVVERFRGVLDREVLFFDDQPVQARDEPQLESTVLGLEARRRRCARRLFEKTTWDARPEILTHALSCLEQEARRIISSGLPYRSRLAASTGDVHLERVVLGLLDCDASRALAACGQEGVVRIARWLRFFDVPLIRHGPVIRQLIPAARLASPAEAVAAAAHAVGQMLQKLLGALRFWGDLSGITTGPQILDRVGTGMVAATSRPAVRLLLLATVILAIKGLALLVPVLDRTATGLWRGLGTPVLVLGAVCLVLMMLGRWLKRIAGEALDLYLRTADAHLYPLLKTWKSGRREQDLETLARTVFAAEARLRGTPFVDFATRLKEECAQTALGRRDPPTLAPAVAARVEDDVIVVANLYRDFIDGPILHRSDDKTSVQLLGNLAVQDVRFQVLGITRRQVRALEKLDLEKQRLLGLGPYFWFRFITESLAIETAKLVMEYNSTCLALDELALATPEKRLRFEAFLQSRRLPWDVAIERSSSRGLQFLGEAMTTDHFTALHFLAADARLEDAVRARYGEAVLAALRRDRVGMVRDVFGARPHHLLPRARRSLNPYRLYQRYLSGALFLFFPLTVLLGVARLLAVAGRDILRLTLDLLGHAAPQAGQPSRVAPFEVAIRKINRMRKPFFMEALRLRAAVDVEYLGLGLPGFPGEENVPLFRTDLDFVGALASERRALEQLREQALQDLGVLREHLDRRGWLAHGLENFLTSLDPAVSASQRRGEAMRALVTAFITDHGGLRSTLTAPATARAFVEQALARKPRRWRGLWLRVRALVAPLIPAWRRRRKLFEAYVVAARHLQPLAAASKARVWRELLGAPRSLARTFERATRVLGTEGGAVDFVEQELRAAARNYPAWTRRILTLRALQAITVLDIQCYRDLVRQAGDYEREA